MVRGETNTANTQKSVTNSAQSKLLGYFNRNGHIRLPDLKRRKKKDPEYKKGYEIRFVAYDKKELAEIRELLRSLGLTVAKFHKKGNLLVQPVYGELTMKRFWKTE